MTHNGFPPPLSPLQQYNYANFTAQLKYLTNLLDNIPLEFQLLLELTPPPTVGSVVLSFSSPSATAVGFAMENSWVVLFFSSTFYP